MSFGTTRGRKAARFSVANLLRIACRKLDDEIDDLKTAGINSERGVTRVSRTGASSFNSITPKLERGEIGTRITHGAYGEEFRRYGYVILADLAVYLPQSYQWRATLRREP